MQFVRGFCENPEAIRTKIFSFNIQKTLLIILTYALVIPFLAGLFLAH